MSPRQEYREKNKERWEAMEDQLDRLIDLRDQVAAGGRILLVGRNATGKSLFRGLINSRTLKLDKKVKMVHSSMALRTGNFASLGALSGMFNDNGEDATSNASLKIMEGAITNCARWVKEGNPCGLHIDEPEVGCSEELQMAIGPWLRTQIDAIDPKPVVTMVTTHSREIAKHFSDWKFLDTGFEYPTAEAWLTREAKPMSMEELQLNARTLFLVIVERQSAVKAGK